MTLNPQQSLDRLRSCRLAYERARGDRTAQAQALQASITRTKVELATSRHRIDSDVALKGLFCELTFEAEMGKGSLKQQATMVR